VQVTGVLDPAILERCVNAVVQRHEALRTTFGEAAGQPVQRIAAEMELPLAVIDLRDVPATEREAPRDGNWPARKAASPLI
jgi:hypothetical protein